MAKRHSLTILLVVGAVLVSISTLLLGLSVSRESDHETYKTHLLQPRKSDHKVVGLWRDLTQTRNYDELSGSRYSHACCVEHDIVSATGLTEEFGIPGYVGRTCHFDNLFFNPASQSFAYIASPEQSVLIHNRTEFQESITTSRGYIPRTLYNKPKRRHDAVFSNPQMQFLPDVYKSDEAPFDVSKAPTLSFKTKTLPPLLLLYRLSFDFNFGHFIFDDILTLFTMLDLFGYADEPNHQHLPIPFDLDEYDFFYRCNRNSRWKECAKMLKRVSPMLGIDPFDYAGEKYMDTANLFNQSTDWVKIPTTIVGAGDLAYWACIGPCAAQRVSRIYRMRQWVMNQVGIESTQKATTGRILISLPVGNTHEHIETFEHIIPTLKKHFADNCRVYNMAELTLRQQIEETSKAKVYLTNNGGGSASSLFLPKGSTVILFHQPGGPKRDLDWYSNQGYLNYAFLPANSSTGRVLEEVRYALSSR